MWELIDYFNKSFRKIEWGSEKTEDELTSAIRFRTTPKCDLPHYLFIFRNPELLGIELKNVVCSRLGTMLYLEIKRGEEAINTS